MAGAQRIGDSASGTEGTRGPGEVTEQSYKFLLRSPAQPGLERCPEPRARAPGPSLCEAAGTRLLSSFCYLGSWSPAYPIHWHPSWMPSERWLILLAVPSWEQRRWQPELVLRRRSLSKQDTSKNLRQAARPGGWFRAFVT